MLLRHHSEGLVRKHTLISPVHALSDAQSMNQWPGFREKHPMRPHFMCEIGEGSDSAASQLHGGTFMQRHKPDPGEQTCHIQVPEYNVYNGGKICCFKSTYLDKFMESDEVISDYSTVFTIA